MRLTVEQNWKMGVRILNEKIVLDDLSGIYIVIEKNVLDMQITGYFKDNDMWIKIGFNSTDNMFNKMDFLEHINDGQTIVWNIFDYQPKFIQEIRVSYMNRIRESEKCKYWADIWGLKYKVLRNNVMWENTRKNYVLTMLHSCGRENILQIAYEKARIRHSFTAEILENAENISVLGSPNYSPPANWEKYLASIKNSTIMLNPKWTFFKLRNEICRSDPLAVRVYWFMKNQQNWWLRKPKEVWECAMNSTFFNREEKKILVNMPKHIKVFFTISRLVYQNYIMIVG